MRAYLHETGELASPRWRALCKSLRAETPGERWRVYGHLCGWWGFWMGQAALDCGLWFDLGLAEVGRWAQAEGQELAWGRALLGAGYVARIEARYPPPLARQGWVALNGMGGAMLDDSFAYFSRHPDAARLCLYISAPVKRVQWARRLGLDAAAMDADGAIPPGWLGDAGREEVDGGRETGGSRGDAWTSAGRDRAGARLGGERPVVGFAAPAPPAQDVVARKERTAKRPSLGVLEDVRTWKYQDPLRACMAMDDSPLAVKCWRAAVARDRQAVMDGLGDLVETDGRWQALKNPAAVLMAHLRRRGALG